MSILSCASSQSPLPKKGKERIKHLGIQYSAGEGEKEDREEGRDGENKEGEVDNGREREKREEEEGEQMMATKWSKEAGRDKLKLSHNLSGSIPGNRILPHLGSVPGQG